MINIPTEEELDLDIEINISSIFELEKELRLHPKRESKYFRWAAQAQKELDEAKLELEIVSAEIMNEIVENAKKPIPASGLAETRKMKLPLDSRYTKARRKVISCEERVGILNGLVHSWSSRSHRLTELAKISDRILWNEPVVRDNKLSEAGGMLEF